jgi:extradiol dioxygenase family protein
VQLDHLILAVNDIDESVRFYTEILGLTHEGQREPFTVDRVKAAGIEYGDSFHSVGNMQGPGEEEGSRGAGQAVYMFDPSKHLIEIRHYEG